MDPAKVRVLSPSPTLGRGRMVVRQREREESSVYHQIHEFSQRGHYILKSMCFTSQMTTALQPLTSIGHQLETDPSAWGEFEDSAHLLGDPVALVESVDANGYLCIRNFSPAKSSKLRACPFSLS